MQFDIYRRGVVCFFLCRRFRFVLLPDVFGTQITSRISYEYAPCGASLALAIRYGDYIELCGGYFFVCVAANEDATDCCCVLLGVFGLFIVLLGQCRRRHIDVTVRQAFVRPV